MARKTVKKLAKKATKKAVKRVAKKTAKPTKETKAVAAAPVESGGRGRPKGAVTYTTDSIGLKTFREFSRKSEKLNAPGYRRITLEVSNPDFAPLLETLANIVEKTPDKLVAWLKRAK